MPKHPPTTDETREKVNAQLEATEQRLKREAEAWERKAAKDPATYQRTANTPRELRVLFADLCACQLTTATANRVSAVVAGGFEPEEAMQALCRVLIESCESPAVAAGYMMAGKVRRVPIDTEKRVRRHLKLLLELLEAAQ